MKMVVEIEQQEVLQLVEQMLKDRGVVLSGPLQVKYEEAGEYDGRETVGFKLVADLQPPQSKEKPM